jgi:hypothetical protein
MKKRILKFLIILPFGLLIVLTFIFLLQTSLLKRSLENKWLTAKETEFNGYEFVRCNWSIFEPKVAFVDDYILLGDIKGLEVHFYTQKNLFDFSRDSWSESHYTGGTDVKNTTFKELVKMVKENCSQFQKGYLDYTGYEHLSEQEKDDRYWEIAGKNLQWTYSEYKPEPPEPALSVEDKKFKEEWEEKMRKRYEENSKNYKKIEHTVIEE